MHRGSVLQLGGALITEVVPDAPADPAGVEAGDIIIAVENRAMDDPHDLSSLIGHYEPGEQVVLTRSRRGQDTEVQIEDTLGSDRDEDGEIVAYPGVWYESIQGGMCMMPQNRGPWD